jgi:hypothetical protein
MKSTYRVHIEHNNGIPPTRFFSGDIEASTAGEAIEIALSREAFYLMGGNPSDIMEDSPNIARIEGVVEGGANVCE